MKHLKLFRNIDFNSKENLSKEEKEEKDKKSEEIIYDFYKLENDISKLKHWIHDSCKYGTKLGMKKMIIKIFKENNYYNNIDEEIKKLKNDIEILKKTDYPKIILNEKLEKLEEILEETYLVKTMQDGEMKWDPVNKLNTNYVELSRLIVYLIKCAINDDNEKLREKGKNLYIRLSSVSNNSYKLKKELLSMKEIIENMINYYMIVKSKTQPIDRRVGLGDFKKFTSYIKVASRKGERTEKEAINYLKSNGFEILYEGGNGDLMDMLFWVDIIVKHDVFGYKTIQVKSESSKYIENRYRNIVDWLMHPKYEFDKSKFIILDLKTNEKIQIN